MIQKHSIEKANNLVGGNLNGSTPSFNHAIANIVKGVPVSHSLFPVHIKVTQLGEPENGRTNLTAGEHDR